MSDDPHSELPPVVAESDEAPPVLDAAPPVLDDEPSPRVSTPREGASAAGKWLAFAAGAVVLVGAGYVLGRPKPDSETPTTSAPPPVQEVPRTGADSPSPPNNELATEKSNLAQMALAINMYAGDYDDRFPPNLQDFELIHPYVKSRSFRNSSLDGSLYRANRQLDGASVTSVERPTETPMLFGPVWPDGNRAVAYVDGHVGSTPDRPDFAVLQTPGTSTTTQPPEGTVAIGDHEPTAPIRTTGPVQEYAQGRLQEQFVDGRKFMLPLDWTYTRETNGDVTSHRWVGPNDNAFVKVDINQTAPSDLEASVRKLERGFQTSSRYRYFRTNWRTGSNAFGNGVIWNFRISKDGEPMNKRTIAYWNETGKGMAILTNSREDSTGYSEMFTDILKSIRGD